MSGYVHLGRQERDEIAILRSKGLGVRAISRELNRSASTISRELRRNACDSGSYRPMLPVAVSCCGGSDPRGWNGTSGWRCMLPTGCWKAPSRYSGHCNDHQPDAPQMPPLQISGRSIPRRPWQRRSNQVCFVRVLRFTLESTRRCGRITLAV